MGNVYGIANPGFVAPLLATLSDFTCPAGAGTVVLSTGAIAAPGPGNWFPIVWGIHMLLLGATPPTQIFPFMNINGGATVDSQNVSAALLVANATITLPYVLVGANSATAWVGAGSTLNLLILSNSQALTWKGYGSRAVVALMRGPDA